MKRLKAVILLLLIIATLGLMAGCSSSGFTGTWKNENDSFNYKVLTVKSNGSFLYEFYKSGAVSKSMAGTWEIDDAGNLEAYITGDSNPLVFVYKDGALYLGDNEYVKE